MTLEEAIERKTEQYDFVKAIAERFRKEYEEDPDGEDAVFAKGAAEEHEELALEYLQIAGFLFELKRWRATHPDEIAGPAPTATPETGETVTENVLGERKREHVRDADGQQTGEWRPKRAPIIAVDFDGTLCENAWPEIGPERPEMLQAVREAQARGAKLVLWTNRVGARLREAVDWCTARGLAFDAVNENTAQTRERFVTDSRKVFADIYLDDKACRADSPQALCDTLNETIERLKEE